MTHLGFGLRQFGMANTSPKAFCRVGHCRVAQIGGAASAALFCLPPGGQSLARRLFGSQHVGFSLIAGGTKKRVPLHVCNKRVVIAAIAARTMRWRTFDTWRSLLLVSERRPPLLWFGSLGRTRYAMKDPGCSSAQPGLYALLKRASSTQITVCV